MSTGEDYVVVLTNIRENIVSRPKGNKRKHDGGVGVRTVWKRVGGGPVGFLFPWSCYSVKRYGVDRLEGGGECNSKQKRV